MTLVLTCVTPFVGHAEVPHAGGQLLHRRLLALAARARVTVLAPRTPENEAAAAHPSLAAPVHLVDVGHRPHAPAASLRTVLRAARGDLDSHAGAWPAPTLSLSPVREVLAASDAVEVHWADYLPLLPGLRRAAPQAVLSAYLHDVLSEARASRARNPLVWRPERLAFRVGDRRVRRAERTLLSRADVVHVLKQQDADRLGLVGPKVLVAQPWLDLPAPAPGPGPEPVALFVGALWREENAEAAQWLVREVWPRVLQQAPRARLRLVGARPAEQVQLLASSSVDVVGFVSDLGEEYRRARVAVAPLSDAAGLKVKVPQAMAWGLPVVASTGGAAGVWDAPEGALAGRADDAAGFADAVAAVLLDPARARAVGRAARAYVESRFDFAADIERSLELYAALGSAQRGPARAQPRMR